MDKSKIRISEDMLASNEAIGIVEFDRETKLITQANNTFSKWFLLTHKTSFGLNNIMPALEIELLKFETTNNAQTHSFELQYSNQSLAEPDVYSSLIIDSNTSHSDNLLYLICWKSSANRSNYLHKEQPIFQKMIELAPIGLICIDAKWQCQYVNSEFCRLIEESETAMKGFGWTSMFDPQQQKLKHIIANLISHAIAKTEVAINISSSKKRTLEFELQAHYDSTGEIENVVGVLVDISELSGRQAKIHQLVNYDAVTELHNRNAIEQQLSRYLEVAQNIKTKISLAFVGINKFRQINDLYGYLVGDKILLMAAERISQLVRGCDMLGRFTGDEYAILLPGNIDEIEVDILIKNIIAALAMPFLVNDHEIHLTTNAGITVFEQENFEEVIDSQVIMQEMFKQADIAMSVSKQKGENRFARFDLSQSNHLTSVYNIIQHLPKAIVRREFCVNYQPIVDFKTGEIVCYEVLIRWTSKELGRVGPDVFIPLAEKHGLINEVQSCMLECVSADTHDKKFNQIKTLRLARIAINLSGLQLCSTKLLNDFIDKIEKLKLNPNQITLEITEQVLVVENADVLRHMLLLKEKGFKFSLDDFGTGYSSLSYLTRFPIDYFKLDRSFISALTEHPKQKSLVEGVLALAKSLNLEVVAEGIETQQQYEMLRDMQCDFMQGYYYSKPLPLQGLIKFGIKNELEK